MIGFTILQEDELQGKNLRNEHGLSVLVECDGERWLMDAGQTAKTLHNADVMGIDLGEVEGLVVSHGHYDHAGGVEPILQRYPEIKVYAHQIAAEPKYGVSEVMTKYNGWPNIDALKDKVTWLNGHVVRLSDRLTIFTIEQPAPANVRLCKRAGDKLEPDTFADEYFALFRSDDGETLLYAGCTHHGMHLLSDTLRKEFGTDHLDHFVGGLHIVGRPEEVFLDVKTLLTNELHIDNMCAVHCTGPDYRKRLRNF